MHGDGVEITKLATVLRVTSGNFFEMFDFFLFGFYAGHIAKAFYPAGNELTSLLFTFMTFGAGILMRPLGAMILGSCIDKVGRRKGPCAEASISRVETELPIVGTSPGKLKATYRLLTTKLGTALAIGK